MTERSVNIMANNTGRDQITFEIKEHIGVIETSDNGWSLEANIVQWNGGADKLDIRFWSPDHQRMQRGSTFTKEQAAKLTHILQARFA